MTRFELTNVFENQLDGIDREVYARLKKRVAAFYALVPQIEGICNIANSRHPLSDYLQVLYVEYEAKQVCKLSWLDICDVCTCPIVYRTHQGDYVNKDSQSFLLFETIERLYQELVENLSLITKELFSYKPDRFFVIDAVYALLCHSISQDLPEEVQVLTTTTTEEETVNKIVEHLI